MCPTRLHILVLLVCTATVEIAAVCQPSPMDLESQFSNSCANLQLPAPMTCQGAWESFVEGFSGRIPSRSSRTMLVASSIESGVARTYAVKTEEGRATARLYS